MPARNRARREARVAQAGSGAPLRQREFEAQSAENALSRAEALLGSDHQAFGVAKDPRLTPYTYRYDLDQRLANVYQAADHSMGVFRSMGDITATRDRANDLMAQAEQAARLGDYDRAEQLRSEAQSAIPSQYGLAGMIPDMFQLLPTAASEQLRAEELAFSPGGQIVGEQLRRVRDLQQRGEGYDEFLETLTRDSLDVLDAERTMANRQLASSYRSDVARMGESAAGRGAARSSAAEAAMAGRLGSVYAMEKANIHLQVATEASKVSYEARRFLEQYTDELSGNSIQLMRFFTQTSPQFREEHQQRLDQIAGSIVNMNIQFAEWAQKRADMLEHEKIMADRAQTQQWISLGIAAGAALLTFGVGAIGGIAGAGAGAAASAGGSALGSGIGIGGGTVLGASTALGGIATGAAGTSALSAAISGGLGALSGVSGGLGALQGVVKGAKTLSEGF